MPIEQIHLTEFEHCLLSVRLNLGKPEPSNIMTPLNLVESISGQATPISPKPVVPSYPVTAAPRHENLHADESQNREPRLRLRGGADNGAKLCIWMVLMLAVLGGGIAAVVILKVKKSK